MLKMIIESWKREGMTREAFMDHLANAHGPLVRRHGPAMGFRKYLQSLRLPSPEIDGFAEVRGWPAASDASVEIWVDDAMATAAASSTDEASQASAILEDDERRFVDPSRISAFLAREEVIFDYLAPGSRFADKSRVVKMVCQVWKRPDFTTAAFQERWRTEHGDLVRTHAKAMGFLRYVQSHRVPAPAIDAFAKARGWREAPDGLTEIWWESLEALQAAFASPDAEKANTILIADEVKFVNSSRVTAFLAREHMVFDASREFA